MEDHYRVPQCAGQSELVVAVPGSKSITNRGLLLAALSYRQCVLKGVLFSDDSRAVLECLDRLGFAMQVEEKKKQVVISGSGGQIPNRKAELHVRSAGTAARFLTVLLAAAGGEYTLRSSEQMKKRPMEQILSVLRKAGAEIICLEEEGHFPFTIRSEGFRTGEVSVDTGVSSQFASALLMAGVLTGTGLLVCLEGDRVESPYIGITLGMMKQFGIRAEKEGKQCRILPSRGFGIGEYQIEPDVSGGCYFYAMAALLKRDVLVKNIHRNSMQGDIRFLDILEKQGCILEETKEGLWVRGKERGELAGMNLDMRDYSDQTMTAAVLAPFAAGETRIRNVGHIRFQESDRIGAIVTELGRIGIFCEAIEEGTGIRIVPGAVLGGVVKTYEDHRMAMAFSLIGLKTGNIIIQNPGCCAKTFENYFELLEEIAKIDRSETDQGL